MPNPVSAARIAATSKVGAEARTKKDNGARRGIMEKRSRGPVVLLVSRAKGTQCDEGEGLPEMRLGE